MATYKVLQDIEAEDKLFGPFTLKQFIFGAITIGLLFIGFRILIMGVPIFIKLPFIAVMLPFIILFGFLAAPLSRDQPNDIWLVARLRFMFKPRVRIWNQDGISDLVTITAPKKVEHVYSNNFTQTEVKSRLNALASTLDSRGWAVKNVSANLFAQPGYLSDDGGSDRLINTVELPQEVSGIEVLPSDDMLDAANNTTAQHLDQLMRQSTERRKQQIVSNMTTGPAQPAAPQQPAKPAQDYWFLNQPNTPSQNLPQDYATFASQQVVQPGSTDDTTQTATATPEEEALARKLVEEKEQAASHTNDHMKVLQPLHDREGNIVKQQTPAIAPQPPAPTAPSPAAQTRQEPVNPAILGLANNDDLDVATIARQAKKMNGPDDGEVVISLH